MRTKSPSEAIPNLDNLYETLKSYVKENQGERGFVKTYFGKGGNDTIYGIRYDFQTEDVQEVIVHGIRVFLNDIEILVSPIVSGVQSELDDEFYGNGWESLRWSDAIYYIPTLFSVAEFIEEYA